MPHLRLPIVALATTELPLVIEDGVHGYLSCDVDTLMTAMQSLLDDPATAHKLGTNARDLAQSRFGLDRFRRDWQAAFARVLDRPDLRR